MKKLMEWSRLEKDEWVEWRNLRATDSLIDRLTLEAEIALDGVRAVTDWGETRHQVGLVEGLEKALSIIEREFEDPFPGEKPHG